MVQDRRRHARSDLDGTATLGAPGADLNCRVVNLSRSGALIRCDRPLNEMDMVTVQAEFDLDSIGVQKFTCEAAVVRCSRRPDGQYDIGLFFTALDDSEQERLERIRKAASTPANA